MKTEGDWVENVVSRYPTIFRAYKRPGRYPRASFARWGFECGAGWAAIVDEFASWLELEALRMKSLGKRCPLVVQVKEKLGTLCFYVTHIPSEIADEFANRYVQAERKSSHTCEQCGKPGKLRRNGWLRTLCDKHERDYQKQ